MEGLYSFNNSRKMKNEAQWERGGREIERQKESPLAGLGLQWITRRGASWSRAVGQIVTFRAAHSD